MGGDDRDRVARRRRARRESSGPIAIVLIVVAVVVGGGIAASFALRAAQPPKPAHASTRPPAPPAPIVDAPPPAEAPPDAAPVKAASAPGRRAVPPPPPPSKTADCSAIRAPVLRVIEARMDEPTDASKTMAGRIADAHVQHCAADHWAPAVVACLAAAKGAYNASDCFDKLSSDQQWRLAGDISPLAMGALAEPQATASAHPDPTCAAAAAHAVDGLTVNLSQMIDLISADRRPAARAHVARAAPFMKTGVTRVCSDDKWTADTIACLDGARSDYDMGRCAQQLPDAQRAHYQKAMAAAMGMPDHYP